MESFCAKKVFLWLVSHAESFKSVIIMVLKYWEKHDSHCLRCLLLFTSMFFNG